MKDLTKGSITKLIFWFALPDFYRLAASDDL